MPKADRDWKAYLPTKDEDRKIAKDTVDEHFLPVGAAPQREQIAGPKVWDQIRSRRAIITFYCQNSIKE